MLMGRQRQFLLCYVTGMTTAQATVRPIFIGQRLYAPDADSYPRELRQEFEVWPQHVDQFARVNFDERLKKSDLESLRGIPESQVKEWFAQILGEPTVPKDWGGEQFDLWTTRITVDGERLRAAVAFKGPARFHPMTIADLGKNGDQIDRLADTAAGLLVVQHCHEIEAPVMNMLRAYATSSENPRRYMAIDGYDTVRILRSFGYFK
jgi:hypothetical protein